MDGADESSIGLPHFVSGTINDKGHSLKVFLVITLDRGKPNKPYLYTEKHETGASHVIEAINRFINKTAK